LDSGPRVDDAARPDAEDSDLPGDAQDQADARDLSGDEESLAEADAASPVPLAACRAASSDWIPLPEASGAARLGPRRYLVIADSGNEGRGLIVDEAAQVTIPVTLPLGAGAGDDLEGLDIAPDGRVFGITSAGWLRAWRFESEGSQASLVFGPARVSDDPEWTCAPNGVNCGPNYEGLCLHPAPDGAEGDRCAGWLVSKARGELVCLRTAGEGYRVDTAVLKVVAPANQLSGCAYEPEPPYRLVVAGNVFSGDRIWEVGDHDIEQLPESGAGNQETLLVLEGARPGAPRILSFGDLQELSDGQSPRVVLDCR
jgi:hypothetical protein